MILNIAHRGASGYAPENTFAAFDKALEMNVDYIELDVHLSKDDYLVVIHDATVDRTTNGSGYVKDLTLEELKQLDAGLWFSQEFKNQRIPTLLEVLERYSNKVGLLIEVKNPILYPNVEKKLADELHAFSKPINHSLDVKVQSFSLHAMKKFKTYSPSITSGVILNRFVSYRELVTIAEYTDFLTIHKTYITSHLSIQAHQLGLKLFAWTVNDLNILLYLLNLGIDGVIVDYPELIQSIA